MLKDVLVPVLPDYPLRRLPLYAVYVSRKYVPLKIRSFIDHLVDHSEKLAKAARRR
jgi:DNA-binding transcriptional LysR family regulator